MSVSEKKTDLGSKFCIPSNALFKLHLRCGVWGQKSESGLNTNFSKKICGFYMGFEKKRVACKNMAIYKKKAKFIINIL